MGLSERRSICRELSNIGYSWNSLTYLCGIILPVTHHYLLQQPSQQFQERLNHQCSNASINLLYSQMATIPVYHCLCEIETITIQSIFCALWFIWGTLAEEGLVPEIGSYKSLSAFPDPAFLNDVFSWLVQLCLQIYCSIYLQLGPFMALHRTHKQHEYKLKPILESGRETDRCCRLIWDFLLNKRSLAELPDLLLMAWGYSHETLKLRSALLLTSFSLVQRVLCLHPGATSSKASSPVVFYSSRVVCSVVTVLLQESSSHVIPLLKILKWLLTTY